MSIAQGFWLANNNYRSNTSANKQEDGVQRPDGQQVIVNTMQYTQRLEEGIQKFHRALQELKRKQINSYLQECQFYSHRQILQPHTQASQPSYPFVLDISSDQIIVHFGPDTQTPILLTQRQNNNHQQSQLPQQQFVTQSFKQEIQCHCDQNLKKIDAILLLQNTQQVSYQNQTFYQPLDCKPVSKYMTTRKKVTKGENNSPLIKKRIKKTSLQLQQQLQSGKNVKETKNIPKNYSKAILGFCHKDRVFLSAHFPEPNNYKDFLGFLNREKRVMSNISQLCSLLKDRTDDMKKRNFNRMFRIIRFLNIIHQPNLSSYFLKKNAVCYVFHSKIVQVNWHLKYRWNLMKAIKNPEQFIQLKHIP